MADFTPPPLPSVHDFRAPSGGGGHAPALTPDATESRTCAVLASGDLLYGRMVMTAWHAKKDRPSLLHKTSAREALHTMASIRTKVLIIGPHLQDADEIGFLGEVQSLELCKQVLVITARYDEQARITLRHPAVVGVFDPTREDEASLVKALDGVCGDGDCCWPHAMLHHHRGSQSIGFLDGILSNAELRVFRIIADGSDDCRVAIELSLSIETARTHRRNIMRKLGISSGRQLVAEAVRLGVLRLGANGQLHVFGATNDAPGDHRQKETKDLRRLSQ
jgi:DNA-binding NarL/FixJ family response regulator